MLDGLIHFVTDDTMFHMSILLAMPRGFPPIDLRQQFVILHLCPRGGTMPEAGPGEEPY
jgi:hypothetical protein